MGGRAGARELGQKLWCVPPGRSASSNVPDPPAVGVALRFQPLEQPHAHQSLLTALAAALVVAVSPAKADGGNERILPVDRYPHLPPNPAWPEGHGYVPVAAITDH